MGLSKDFLERRQTFRESPFCPSAFPKHVGNHKSAFNG
jgi:hypothetical protein